MVRGRSTFLAAAVMALLSFAPSALAAGGFSDVPPGPPLTSLFVARASTFPVLGRSSPIMTFRAVPTTWRNSASDFSSFGSSDFNCFSAASVILARRPLASSSSFGRGCSAS